jgi:hypothetical protein
VPTAVLALVGLTINSAGLVAGTIPVGFEPQTLTAQIGVSDAEFTVTFDLIITVADASTAAADWAVRSRADGVFWACNGEEFVRGIPGYTTQPMRGFPSGISGRRVTTINSIAEQPAIEEVPLERTKYEGNEPDGGGAWRHTG